MSEIQNDTDENIWSGVLNKIHAGLSYNKPYVTICGHLWIAVTAVSSATFVTFV